MLDRMRTWLFGRVPSGTGQARRIGTALLHQIAHGGVRELSEPDLMELVDYLLTTASLRSPLRGNTRFLSSVAAQYHKKRALSPKQRQAIYNILERAYPHNLAVELRRFT